MQALGANALAAAAAATAEIRPAAYQQASRPQTHSAQPLLFADENSPKVIPFSRKSATVESLPETAELFPPKVGAPKQKAPPKRKAAGDSFGDQTTLDFLPTASPLKSRTLKTTVEAVIYCDAPVASPMHRAMAATLDASMIVIGFGIFLVIFQIFGGAFAWSKQNIALVAAALGLISMFYGFVWVLAGRETMGMAWTSLRILNFNGFPPDRKSRALRMLGCWLSFCSGMIGIFWALVDEESLTWHDHMSKTFPTLRETNTGFFRP
ncbi:MAG: domain containing protein [Bryobacterales bacterium]|nr:domain containing protein [Bryobacterales bacterium]